MSNPTEAITKAGDVLIEKIDLICEGNRVLPLNEFLIELNLYEDLFNNALHGNIFITDSRNIIQEYNIKGQEELVLQFRTPTFAKEQGISLTLRTYKITDRNIVRDNNTQNFVLHFTTKEMFKDVVTPLSQVFEGSVKDVANKIFTNFLRDVSNSNLFFITAVDNPVKFIPARWTPFKCINWLASKSIPLVNIAKSCIFGSQIKTFILGL